MSLASYLTVTKAHFGSTVKGSIARSTMSTSKPQLLSLPDPLYDGPTTSQLCSTVVLDSSKGDGCLIALIKSEAFQRLHQVLQHGISASAVLDGELCAGSRVSRYQHSVGAMLLVRRLGASMEEQLAALLHDVSHTALSHVVDNIFDGRVVHEEDKWLFLNMTEIPSILTSYGFDPQRICDEDNFGLLERDAPKLCADRCDYGVRDAHAFGLLTLEEGQRIVASFVAHEGEIAMKDRATARLFAEAYMQADAGAWSHPVHAAHYHSAAEALKEAFRVGQVTLEDFWRSESCDQFWQRCVDSPHPTVATLAAKVRPGLEARELVPGEIPGPGQETIEVRCKVRAIDPPVVQPDGSKRPLSEMDHDFAESLRRHRARGGEKVYLVTHAA